MKTTTLFLLFSLFSFCAIAQEMSGVTNAIPKVHKNVIKFLPVNLYFNNISLEYERKFSPKNSFIVGVGIPSEKSFISKFSSNVDPNDFNHDLLRTTAIRAAFRHYSGLHTQAAGFYVSPYLKYQTYSVSGKRNESTNLGMPFSEDIKIDGSTVSAGLQFGAQLMIAKRVCIDFYFLGIEAGLATFDEKVTSSSSDPTVQNAMNQYAQDFKNDLPSFIGDKLTVSQTGSTIGIKGASIPYPWFRGGISIGIAF
jgi:hypothetical protein